MSEVAAYEVRADGCQDLGNTGSCHREKRKV